MTNGGRHTNVVIGRIIKLVVVIKPTHTDVQLVSYYYFAPILVEHFL